MKKKQVLKCLLAPGEDPRPTIAEKLIAWMPERGSILAYNASFEARVINELASRHSPHAIKLNAMVDRLRDPMSLFRSRQMYLWPLQGSYSMKVVLPALVPELNYENEEIRDGGMASGAWLRMAEWNDPKEIARIGTSLLSYCRLDTYGVVKILEKLREFAGK